MTDVSRLIDQTLESLRLFALRVPASGWSAIRPWSVGWYLTEADQ